MAKKKQKNNTTNIVTFANKDSSLQPKSVSPMTENQKKVFRSYGNNRNIMMHGCSGTGKTFLALYLALREIFSGNSPYRSIYLIRNGVPTRKMGFLPGNQKEKDSAYEHPYISICSKIFGRADAYQILKQKKIIEFFTNTFIRGDNFDNCIVIVDEAQNFTWHELNSIVTRFGSDCKVILCGDVTQTDLRTSHEHTGLRDLIQVIKQIGAFDFIELTAHDIVRSDFVKEYVIARDRLIEQGRVERL